jgi:glycerophosphoryl diester phosphodiesterase
MPPAHLGRRLASLVAGGVLALAGCSSPGPNEGAAQASRSSASTAPKPASSRTPGSPFDLQAHRGGMGLTTEEQPAAFAKALSLGVSTLELDTQVSADGKVIVSHDRLVDAKKCRDAGSNGFVGKAIKDLTLDQIRSLDCGFVRYPGFDEQEVVTGGALAELKDVVAVWRAHDAKDVWFDIEIKFDPSKPAESVGREEFVRTVVDEINALGIADRTMVQAFDWLTLVEVNRLEPQWPLVALTSTDDYPPSLAAGVPGVEVYAPKETIVTKAMVAQAHESGLRVIPWTVDDPSRMEVMVALGVDGLITNYPDRARTVLAKAGVTLPPPLPAR